MAENKENKGIKSKIKAIVTFIILYCIDQLFRIIDAKWFVLGFALLFAFILLGGLSDKLRQKKKSSDLVTDN